MQACLMLLLLMLFAALNLYLGFATAVYMLRRKGREPISDYLLFLAHGEVLDWNIFLPARASSPPSRPATRIAPTVAMASTAASSPVESAGAPETAADASPSGESRAEGAASGDSSAGGEMWSPAESADVAGSPSPAPKVDPLIAIFEKGRNQLREFTSELARLEQHFRGVAAAPETAALQACGVSLNEAVERRMQQLAEVFRPLSDGSLPAVEESPVRGVFGPTIVAATAQLNEVLAELGGLPFDAEAGDAVTQPMSSAYATANELAHALRDTLTDKLAELVRDEVGLHKLPPHLRSDQHTGLAGRLDFERCLLDGLSQPGGQASLILIDIDGLRAVNRRYGVTAGDGIVSIVAQFVAKACEHDQSAARTGGQRFALLCRGAAVHETAETAERVRQSIEKTTFLYRGQRLRITVSAAVVGVRADDHAAALLGRALATVGEAKSYGRNRTFLCEDECPTPVVPLEMIVEEQHVTL